MSENHVEVEFPGGQIVDVRRLTADHTLTDEELVEIERALPWWGLTYDAMRKVRLLIAALRASREQVKAVKAVLRAKSGLIDHLQDDLRASREEVERLRQYIQTNPMRACYEEAEAERDALQVEVERLRAEVADLQCDPSAEYDAACDLRSHPD